MAVYLVLVNEEREIGLIVAEYRPRRHGNTETDHRRDRRGAKIAEGDAVGRASRGPDREQPKITSKSDRRRACDFRLLAIRVAAGGRPTGIARLCELCAFAIFAINLSLRPLAQEVEHRRREVLRALDVAQVTGIEGCHPRARD